jgi:hypothetical protein
MWRHPEKIASEEVEDTLEVKCGLLMPEQVSYARAWQRELNPERKDLEVLYGGIGSDVAFIFNMTEAKTVYGIDATPITEKELERCLKNWDTIDTIDFPFQVNQTMKNAISDGQLDSTSKDSIYREFLKGLEQRRRDGYWDKKQFGWFTTERLIMFELKKMGVSPESISITQTDNGLKLNFEWQGKQRRVVYIESNIFEMDRDPVKSKIPRVDIALVKSVPATVEFGNIMLDILDTFIDDKGAMIYGAVFGTEEKVDGIHQRTLRHLDSLGYNEISLPDEYTDSMLKVTSELKNNCRYGWQLFGSRKRS